MNGGGVTARGDLLHNFTCASHGHPASLDIGKCVCLLSEFKFCLFEDDR